MIIFRGLASLLAATILLAAPPERLSDNPNFRAAIEQVSADSLRGHVSFLASDLLEGRDTPSRGLDIAAEYIAAQFRGAGLTPAGDDGYFQTSEWIQTFQQLEGFEMTVITGGKAYPVKPEQVRADNSGPVELRNAPVVRWKPGDEVKPEELRGRVVAVALDHSNIQSYFTLRGQLNNAGPALIIVAIPAGGGITRGGSLRAAGAPADPPTIVVHDEDLNQALAESAPAKITVRLRAPIAKPVRLKNVIGLLPGSDPVLKDTYILVTAHYDHIGVKPGSGDGDRIYNGANDDASGVSSVIELASALRHMKEPLKRSIVFITFFGEEKGLFGSRYYGRHAVFPVAKTVAEVNLEHMGRTDDKDGRQTGSINFTGQDYSNLPSLFTGPAAEAGVKVLKHPSSDMFFAQSDNQALADLGVPAHTISVVYMFPDYHQPGDEWPKLDYDNMAQVDRGVALGLIALADNPETPRWNESNPGAAKYLEAWKKLHPVQ